MCVNTLLGTNTPGGNCFGSITDAGHKLSSDTTCAFTHIGSMTNTDPKLGSLANYGGPTFTLALLPESPALDATDPLPAPPLDQRGFSRPAGDTPDIGAFEFGAVPLLFMKPAANGELDFQAWGTAGRSCRLLASTNLVDWTPVATNQMDLSGGCQFQQDTPRASSRDFIA